MSPSSSSQPQTVSTSCWLSRNPSTTYDANGDLYVSYERLSFDGAPWNVWTRTRSGGAWGSDTNLTNNPGGVRGFSPPKAFYAYGNNVFHVYTNTTANLYEDIWAACLKLYDAKHGIDFEWQAEDGTYVRSPLGGKRERPQPDRPRKTGHERPCAD